MRYTEIGLKNNEPKKNGVGMGGGRVGLGWGGEGWLLLMKLHTVSKICCKNTLLFTIFRKGGVRDYCLRMLFEMDDL